MEKWVQTSDFKVKRDDVVLRIGDYINYHDCAGKNDTDLYKGRWQVLGADDTGNLLIVSESNVTTHHFNKELTLEGAMKAYSTAVETLNKICEVYSSGTGATHARSICMEDVDKLTGVDKTKDSNYGKSYTIKNKKGDTFVWYDGTNWHKTRDSKKVTLTNTKYSNDNIDNLPTKVYDMLSGKKIRKRYWLATSYVDAYSYCDCAYFGIRYVNRSDVTCPYFVRSDGDWTNGATDIYFDYDLGVRAVVTLKSNINITPKKIILIEWKIN